jgi:hypothetical protein
VNIELFFAAPLKNKKEGMSNDQSRSSAKLRRSGMNRQRVAQMKMFETPYRHFQNEKTKMENPKGISAQSPGLRGTSYPGKSSHGRRQPQRGCGFGARRMQAQLRWVNISVVFRTYYFPHSGNAAMAST